MSAKRIKIPKNIWASFIDVLYAAALHIDPSSVDPECMGFIQYIVREALSSGDLIVVDGKIMDKKKYNET